MTRSKPSLRNSAKRGLLCLSSFLLFAFVSGGCDFFPAETKPTYTEQDIPAAIQKICKEEYGIDVTISRSANTLWIYTPISRILHSEFGKNPDKIFDDVMQEKARNVLTATSRVLLSAEKTPECFVMVVSDVVEGLDYTITANCLDIKKSYAGAIPWPEANRRFVIGLSANEKAVGDKTGAHVKPYGIKTVDFLAAQIAQRIRYRFAEEDLKKQVTLAGVSAQYSGDTFFISYALTVLPKAQKTVDFSAEMLRIAAYCLKTYDFKDFASLELVDLDKKKMKNYTREEILSMKVL